MSWSPCGTLPLHKWTVSTAMFHPLFYSCETTSHAYIGFVLAWMRRMATFGTPYRDSMMWISLSLSLIHVYLPEREVQFHASYILGLKPNWLMFNHPFETTPTKKAIVSDPTAARIY